MDNRETKRIVLIIFIGVLFFISSPSIWAQERTQLKVVSEIANIRQNPDIGSAIIHQLPQGTVLEATQKKGEWYVIQLKLDAEKTLSGYVHESLVTVIGGPAPEEIETTEPEKEEARKEPVEVEVVEEARPVKVQPQVQESLDVASEYSKFRLSFSGGMGYVPGGDINEGAVGLGDYFAASLGESQSNTVSPLHTGLIFEGEMNIAFSPKFFLNIGGAYLSGKKESLIEYPEGTYVELYTTRPQIRSIPIRLSFSYYPHPAFYIKLGGEYHFAKCSYFYRYEEADFWQEWKGDSNGQGPGAFGGLGVEANPVGNVRFFLEALGRYCKITNFSGTDEYNDSTGYQSTENGTLYIYQAQITEDESYTLLYIRERKPSEAGVSDAKEATIDLSGFEVRVGIRFKF
ncbi:MAG: SH3 domain-containing protein [Candidatus Aminicenantes bacterium]